MKILLVEDEIKLAKAIKRGLEPESMHVDIFNDGPSGLAAALSDDYDLLILDRMLPGGVDGDEIIKRAREAKIKAPILMLTAKAQIKDRVSGLNIGADDYLTKPFVFDELVARVRALARRPYTNLGPVLKVGELSLNPATKEVIHQGQEISLSLTEFNLLEYLMRNAGQVLTKDMIINSAWDSDSDVLPNTVEVYIKYLRNKIDKPFGANLIKTVRTFGYKISQD